MTGVTSDPFELLHEVAAEWIKIGLSTGPADRELAEASMERAYSCQGEKPPLCYVWLNSQREATIAAAALAGYVGKGPLVESVTSQVWDQLDQPLRTKFEHYLRSGKTEEKPWIAESPGVLLGPHVVSVLRILDPLSQRTPDYWRAQETIFPIVWREIEPHYQRTSAHVWGRDLWEELFWEDWMMAWQIKDHQLNPSGYGQQDAAGISIYDYLRRVGRSISEAEAALCDLTKSCGWWWAFEDFALLTERPKQ